MAVFSYPLPALFLYEVRVGVLARLVNVVRSFLEAEPAHRAHEEEGQPQGVDVQLEGVEVLVLGVPDVL